MLELIPVTLEFIYVTAPKHQNNSNLLSSLTWKTFHADNFSVQSKIYGRVRERSPALVTGQGCEERKKLSKW